MTFEMSGLRFEFAPGLAPVVEYARLQVAAMSLERLTWRALLGDLPPADVIEAALILVRDAEERLRNGLGLDEPEAVGLAILALIMREAVAVECRRRLDNAEAAKCN